MKFKNPIISGFYPDPSICKVENDFYLVTSSFEYFPGVPIFHSTDLVNWEQIGHCLTTPKQLPLNETPSSCGIYAPTIRYHEGVFYRVTTNVLEGGNFYITATDPAGPWSEPIWFEDSQGIDPSFFFDEDGKCYLTGTGGDHEKPGIYQVEIDVQTGKYLSERKLIWEGTGGAYPEGPHVYKIGKYYYLMISEGGTEYGHMLTISRSKNPYGPFESYEGNPILTHRSLNHPIQATGHADLVQHTDGSWWAVFLAFRPIGYPKKHHLGRETFLAPVTWTEDGWPIVGEMGVIGEEIEHESITSEQRFDWKERENFDQSVLDHKWIYRRNPIEENYVLNEQEGSLSLLGSSATLRDTATHTFIGRRQEHFNCEVSTLMHFDPQNAEEAGLSIFANENYHYEIGLRHVNGKTEVFFRKNVGSISVVEKSFDYEEGTIELRILADPEWYKFEIVSPNGEVVYLGSGECGLLATEVSGGFTGNVFGLYATGNGEKSLNEAHFDWFNYKVNK